jgi:hypothetical protein
VILQQSDNWDKHKLTYVKVVYIECIHLTEGQSDDFYPGQGWSGMVWDFITLQGVAYKI